MKAIKRILILSMIFCFLGAILTLEGAYALDSRKSKKRGEGSGTTKKVKWVKSKWGLDALIKLSGDRSKMVREYNKETENYDELKKGINHGQLEKGESASSIRKRWGEPVISFLEENGQGERWVYKPGEVSFFDDEKIYLFFDAQGTLINWQEVEPGS